MGGVKCRWGRSKLANFDKQLAMAYQIALMPMTLNDHGGHSPVAGLSECNSSTNCAAFYKTSTHIVLAWSLCVS